MQDQWIADAVGRYERPLVRYARRWLGDLELARDAVQETFFRLCREPREKVEENLQAWLYTVCRRIAIDTLRKESRMSALSEAHAGSLVSRESDPATTLEHQERLCRVHLALQQLPARQQEAVRLKLQDGLSYRDIAGVMETSIGNVGYLIHHGLTSLRALLAEEDSTGTESRAMAGGQHD